ncbi:hypothetical protein J2W76_003450 [Methylorubrum zatmanii]|nr:MULTISPECIES: hypothetical protein [Methylorubrum]MCP1550205.1 hypothetical protein [Methylorubrum zatmanii]MCP1553181.1 hypothetical protein [Methylorubrum extorquens]MCP1580507.1 hypothetical protein [Methylorubrum extorquens]
MVEVGAADAEQHGPRPLLPVEQVEARPRDRRDPAVAAEVPAVRDAVRAAGHQEEAADRQAAQQRIPEVDHLFGAPDRAALDRRQGEEAEALKGLVGSFIRRTAAGISAQDVV